MKNYDRVNPRTTENIEDRKAYVVGGGIAGLSNVKAIYFISQLRILSDWYEIE